MIPLTIICAALIGLVIWERRQNAVREKEWSLERGALLTRIQAPAAAPFILDPENGEMQYVPFDDDEAYNEAREHLEEVGYSEEQRLTNGE